jgi:hypothetical protein
MCWPAVRTTEGIRFAQSFGGGTGRRVISSRVAQPFRNSLALVLILMLLWSAKALAADLQGNIDVSGKWKGTRAASGQTGSTPYKVQSVSFDLTQNRQTITGSYKCYAGKNANSDCPNPVGKVTSGAISDGHVKIQVQTLPNNVVCSFSGQAIGTTMNGTYTCYAGGTLSSIGQWKVQRY